jgi:predicted nucleic acid-binding protein
MVLLDTNVLLRYATPTDPGYPVTVRAVERLTGRNLILYIVPQNLYEFWVNATRPKSVNGLGLSVPECIAELARIRTTFPILHDLPDLVSEWERLVAVHQCTGKPAHDARLVAAMTVHHIPEILTFNVADFQRYPGITVLDPAKV